MLSAEFWFLPPILRKPEFKREISTRADIIADAFASWGLRCSLPSDFHPALKAVTEAFLANDPYAFLLIDADTLREIWKDFLKSLVTLPEARDLMVVLSASPGSGFFRRYPARSSVWPCHQTRLSFASFRHIDCDLAKQEQSFQTRHRQSSFAFPW